MYICNTLKLNYTLLHSSVIIVLLILANFFKTSFGYLLECDFLICVITLWFTECDFPLICVITLWFTECYLPLICVITLWFTECNLPWSVELHCCFLLPGFTCLSRVWECGDVFGGTHHWPDLRPLRLVRDVLPDDRSVRCRCTSRSPSFVYL